MVILHSKYGLNPALTTCFFCGEPDRILLVGSRVQKFKEAGLCDGDGQMHMNVGCIDTEPCQKCEEYMKQGVILISIRDGEEGDNPYRTGGWCVVKDEAIEQMRPESFVQRVLKRRIAFVHDAAWDALGLPRGEVEEEDAGQEK